MSQLRTEEELKPKHRKVKTRKSTMANCFLVSFSTREAHDISFFPNNFSQPFSNLEKDDLIELPRARWEIPGIFL